MTSKSHGGKREGSGRKRLGSDVKKKMVSFRLSPDLIDYLDNSDMPKSQVIEEALREHKNKYRFRILDQ